MHPRGTFNFQVVCTWTEVTPLWLVTTYRDCTENFPLKLKLQISWSFSSTTRLTFSMILKSSYHIFRHIPSKEKFQNLHPMNSQTNGPPKPSFLSITYFPHNTHLGSLHWPKHPFTKRRCQVIQTTKHIWVISSILIIYNFSPNRIRLQTISEDPSTYFGLNNAWNARRTSSIQSVPFRWVRYGFLQAPTKRSIYCCKSR